LLSTAEASAAISKNMQRFAAVQVPIADAIGRVLHQSVHAERDQPPFDRVMMDGIALQFDALQGGVKRFRVAGTQHAGDAVLTIDSPDECVEIMTGAVLPLGADCIVPVERIEVVDGVAELEAGYLAERRQFVHPQASDHAAGKRLLESGTRVSATDMAVISSCGLETIDVGRIPDIRVISTGNELVAPGLPIEPQQIRMSNGPAVLSMLAQHGFGNTIHDHIRDDLQVLRDRLATHLNESQVLVLSGGVSMGKADFVPQVLTDLGVKLVFHKISQRPGKPMWFGIGPQDQAVFALPGNPVSTLVCCRQYVLPALLQACGQLSGTPSSAILAERQVFRPDLTCFLPARITPDESAALVATPVPTNTSGDFAALSGTDGYVELPRGQSEYAAGTVVRLHYWDRF
jgi:molybdopterin molybdotransferase